MQNRTNRCEFFFKLQFQLWFLCYRLLASQFERNHSNQKSAVHKKRFCRFAIDSFFFNSNSAFKIFIIFAKKDLVIVRITNYTFQQKKACFPKNTQVLVKHLLQYQLYENTTIVFFIVKKIKFFQSSKEGIKQPHRPPVRPPPFVSAQ